MKVALAGHRRVRGAATGRPSDGFGVPTIYCGSPLASRLGQRKTKAEVMPALRREVAAYRLGWHAT